MLLPCLLLPCLLLDCQNLPLLQLQLLQLVLMLRRGPKQEQHQQKGLQVINNTEGRNTAVSNSIRERASRKFAYRTDWAAPATLPRLCTPYKHLLLKKIQVPCSSHAPHILQTPDPILFPLPSVKLIN